MQRMAQDSGYNSSGSSIHHSPDGVPSNHGEDDIIRTRSRASSRTSISSIPASILTNLPETMKPTHMRDTPDYTYQPWEAHSLRAVHTIRQREGTFRKPSSVRAMQMHTEDEGDDEFLTPPKRRGGQRISDISIRSAGSSPLKRSPFYSPSGTVSKPKVKKEYPLVLLHCTLLSPSLPIPGLVGHPERQKLLREVLPSVYWKRWKLLEEKIGSGVLRDRGVLISHPEDMYDLLEERLLESLELQRPRLDHGHFLGPDETESDREDRLAQEDSCTESEGEECPDCGGRVARHNHTRKWEIKVFAANGLMRAGAWAAAWKDMEKVDVEVGLWLPADIRADLEREMVHWAPHTETSLSVPLLQEPDANATSIRALTPGPRSVRPEYHTIESREIPLSPSSLKVIPEDDHKTHSPTRTSSQEIDLHTLLINYIRVLASDKRNVAIVFLTILLAFGVINSRAAAPVLDLRPFPREALEYSRSYVSPLQEDTVNALPERPKAEILSAVIQEPVAAPGSSSTLEKNPGLKDDGATPAKPPMVDMEEDGLSAAAEALPVESTQIISEEQVLSDGKINSEDQTMSDEREQPQPASEPESLSVSTVEYNEDRQAFPAQDLENKQDETPETSQQSEPIKRTVDLDGDNRNDRQAESSEPIELPETTEPGEPSVPTESGEQSESEDETESEQPQDSVGATDPDELLVSSQDSEEDDQTESRELLESVEPNEPLEADESNELE
ncbi:hypothetical protein BJX64DRAFT_247786 [Aspergillus heterothallicus]